MGWKDRLLKASFRGVPFEVESDDSTFGRRVETHEYPGRDKPYTEDLGRATRRFTIQAYVIGDNYFDVRDRLIAAVDTPGPGTLIHPFYGEMKICVDGEVRVSHSSADGRMCRISFAFVEAGELSFPSSGNATRSRLFSSSSALSNAISGSFGGFSLSGLPDFVQKGVLSDAGSMLGMVGDAFSFIDKGISSASRLMQGDLSVLLMPPSSGMDFVNQLQKVWRSGTRISTDATRLRNMLTTVRGLTIDKGLSPQATWTTTSTTTRQQVAQRNTVAQAVRLTAINEAVYQVSELPQPPLRVEASKKAEPTPLIAHAVLNPDEEQTGQTFTQYLASATLQMQTLDEATIEKFAAEQPQQLLNWDDLIEIQNQLNEITDRELSRVTDDAVFDALIQVRTDYNTDISARLAQIDRTVARTPSEVAPAIVLAADWYDSAQRASDITDRNRIAHPGFVPVRSLRVPVK